MADQSIRLKQSVKDIDITATVDTYPQSPVPTTVVVLSETVLVLVIDCSYSSTSTNTSTSTKKLLIRCFIQCGNREFSEECLTFPVEIRPRRLTAGPLLARDLVPAAHLSTRPVRSAC